MEKSVRGKKITDPAVLEAFEPYLPALDLFYQYRGRKMVGKQLFWAVDENFGAIFDEHICPKFGWREGAAVETAIVLMRRQERQPAVVAQAASPECETV